MIRVQVLDRDRLAGCLDAGHLPLHVAQRAVLSQSPYHEAASTPTTSSESGAITRIQTQNHQRIRAARLAAGESGSSRSGSGGACVAMVNGEQAAEKT